MPSIAVCGYHWLTGRPCPFCGLTRALFALAGGEWGDALRLNALTPVALLMLATLFWQSPVRGRLWEGGLALFAFYGVCRAFFPWV
jgi:hypothetical protein